MEKDEKNIELIFKYLKNELSDIERDIFNEKLNEDKIFVNLFNDFKKLWEITQSKIEPEIINIDIEEEWNIFNETIKNIEQKESPNIIDLKPKKKKNLSLVFSIAASIIILISLFFVFNNSSKNIDSGNEIFTAQLPDKSEIIINRNSKIKYRKNFIKNREVQLTGDAYFKVEHDAEHPFIVETDKYKIEVIGTEFYVNSNSTTFEVDVKKGKVKVYPKNNPEQKVILVAGEKTIVSDKILQKENIKNENFIAWKSHKIVIDNLSLLEISEICEKTYGIEISFSDHSLQKLRMTATFENQTVESVLNIIETTLNIKIVKQGEKYIIIK